MRREGRTRRREAHKRAGNGRNWEWGEVRERFQSGILQPSLDLALTCHRRQK